VVDGIVPDPKYPPAGPHAVILPSSNNSANAGR